MYNNTSLKILLVEDEEDLSRYFKAALVLRFKKEFPNLKINIVSVDNGDDAVSTYKELNPDLILMDIFMPGMQGDEATELIMKYDPNAHIVVLSAYSFGDNVTSALENGAREAWVKPPNWARIIDYITLTILDNKF